MLTSEPSFCGGLMERTEEKLGAEDRNRFGKYQQSMLIIDKGLPLAPRLTIYIGINFVIKKEFLPF